MIIDQFFDSLLQHNRFFLIHWIFIFVRGPLSNNWELHVYENFDHTLP